MAKDKISNIQKSNDKIKETKAMVKNLMTKLSILGLTNKQTEQPKPTKEPKNTQLVNEAQPIAKKLYSDYTPEDFVALDEANQKTMERFRIQEELYQKKLRNEAIAEQNLVAFQQYQAQNPTNFNQHENLIVNDENYSNLLAANSDDVFKYYKPNPEQIQTLEKTTNIINHQITPAIQQYFAKLGIELGNIDLSYNRIVADTETKNSNQYAAVYLEGKVANNTLKLTKRAYDAIANYKGMTNTTISQESLITINGLTHEALHKLFNLDNRLSIDKGANVQLNNIKSEVREGMVEYYARNITKNSIDNNQSFTVEQKLLASKDLSRTNGYNEFVSKFDNYLNDMTIKLAFSNNRNKTMDYDTNRKYIEKLSANFFLSSDDKIIRLAKELGLPAIMEI
jgi:hypothetical protein